MKISKLEITNYISIKHIEIENIDNTLILVGKNNVGKTSILKAIKVLCGFKEVKKTDFRLPNEPIKIRAHLELNEDDYRMFHERRIISKKNDYEKWLEEFKSKIVIEENITKVWLTVYPNNDIRYGDEINKRNVYIKEILPKLNIANEYRKIDEKTLDIHELLNVDEIIANKCMFDNSRKCINCFQCIPVINKKKPIELSLGETIKLLNYKLYTTNLGKYAKTVNAFFQKSYGKQYRIDYRFDFDIESVMKINTFIRNVSTDVKFPLDAASSSMRSLYILSLLNAYTEVDGRVNGIIMIEQPELHLHPELQKVASDIIYKLSQKNQVMFTTHSHYMLNNYVDNQIKQITIDKDDGSTILGKKHSIDAILDDLGYSANDMMNADFVFIVEGKDDRTKLPMILNKFYNNITNESGELSRVVIIPTNSCTNIKTYANLKFINRGYLKDNFLMIRDSDGKNREELVEQICSFYYNRMKFDDAKIPRIKPENVLVLKYYSIENYFLNPKVMTELGIIKNEEQFYRKVYNSYKNVYKKLRSGENFYNKTRIKIRSVEDVKEHIEEIKIYIRGHNLFDTFYGRYHRKGREKEILRRYIDIAPKEDFKDFEEAIDNFIYFKNRKKEREN